MASTSSAAPNLPVALTIAGSDSGGGAGIQADLLSFAALGVFGTTALTCLTAQNPRGVSAVLAVTPDFLRAQLDQVAAFFPLAAIKTGMLFDAGLIAEVARFAATQTDVPLVVDPVMVATSGALLLRQDAVSALAEALLPRATVITPNLDEAAVLLGWRPQHRDELTRAATELVTRFGTAVLLKGGHLDGPTVIDVLATPHRPVEIFEQRRLAGVDTHGSGCTLAAALAAALARGEALPNAVATARAYLRRGLERPLTVAGRQWIAH